MSRVGRNVRTDHKDAPRDDPGAIFLIGHGMRVAFLRPSVGQPVLQLGLRGAVALSLGLLHFGLSEARAEEQPVVLLIDVGGAPMETRKVTHGVFTRGSATTEGGHEKDEEPEQQVTLTKDFWVGKVPVTRGQFAKFASETRYVTDAEKAQAGGIGWDGRQLSPKKDFTWRNPGFTQTDEHPVVLVSYFDASAFAGWAARKSGKRVRLPTEAEWEFAARGGSTTRWYGAKTEAEALTLGWFKANAGNGTRPVGQKRPNSLGLLDMSGDVSEWCRDLYAPYGDGPVVDPETVTLPAGEPHLRVLRGASWWRDPKRGRSAARSKSASGGRSAEYGFRIVVSLEDANESGAAGQAYSGLPGSAPSPDASAGSGARLALAADPTDGQEAGPLADGEALRLAPIGVESEGASSGLLLVAPLAAASATVAWMLLRRKRPRASSFAVRVAVPRVRSPALAVVASAAEPLEPIEILSAPLLEPARERDAEMSLAPGRAVVEVAPVVELAPIVVIASAVEVAPSVEVVAVAPVVAVIEAAVIPAQPERTREEAAPEPAMGSAAEEPPPVKSESTVASPLPTATRMASLPPSVPIAPLPLSTRFSESPEASAEPTESVASTDESDAKGASEKPPR